MTTGLAAFDAPTLQELERIVQNPKPLDKFGNPIFCQSCTSKIGWGFTLRCPRRGGQTSHHCPFRDPETAQALAEADALLGA